MQKTEIQDIEQIKVDKMAGTARVCLQKVFFKHALESKLERNREDAGNSQKDETG